MHMARQGPQECRPEASLDRRKETTEELRCFGFMVLATPAVRTSNFGRRMKLPGTNREVNWADNFYEFYTSHISSHRKLIQSSGLGICRASDETAPCRNHEEWWRCQHKSDRTTISDTRAEEECKDKGLPKSLL